MEKLNSPERDGMNVISTAPTRISFFGGGTDLPVYYKKYKGMVVNMAINLRHRFQFLGETGELQTRYQVPEGCKDGFYSVFFKEFGYWPRTLIQEFSSVIESGIGSSATASVALLGALYKIRGLDINRQEIAERAWDIEVNKMGFYGGKQDQYAAAFGGANTIKFGRKIEVKPLHKGIAETLAEHISLFYIGSKRKDPKIQEELMELEPYQVKALDGIKVTAIGAMSLMYAGKWEELGHLLDSTWQLKKQSNKKVTTPRINEIYDSAILNGAWGGKLCGSGGGGHMMFMSDFENKIRLIHALENIGCTHIDFSIDWNGLSVRKL